MSRKKNKIIVKLKIQTILSFCTQPLVKVLACKSMPDTVKTLADCMSDWHLFSGVYKGAIPPPIKKNTYLIIIIIINLYVFLVRKVGKITLSFKIGPSSSSRHQYLPLYLLHHIVHSPHMSCNSNAFSGPSVDEQFPFRYSMVMFQPGNLPLGWAIALAARSTDGRMAPSDSSVLDVLSGAMTPNRTTPGSTIFAQATDATTAITIANIQIRVPCIFFADGACRQVSADG